MLKNAFSFTPNDTRQQKIFDIVFGVVAPILCLYFDPILFDLPSPNYNPCFPAPPDMPGLLLAFRAFFYTAIGLGVFFFSLWVIGVNQIKTLSPFFAAIFFIGQAFSLFLGILLTPFTLFGLFYFGIGIFGFIPYLTAAAYARNKIRALRQVEEPRGKVITNIILVALFLFSVSTLTQLQYPPNVPPAKICPYQ